MLTLIKVTTSSMGNFGFEYLNAAFIKRHQNVINQFYRSRAILSMLTGCVVGGALKYKGISLDMEILLMYSSWMISFVLFFPSASSFVRYFSIIVIVIY